MNTSFDHSYEKYKYEIYALKCFNTVKTCCCDTKFVFALMLLIWQPEGHLACKSMAITIS